MTYNEAQNFILKKQSLGIMPGLTRIQNILNLINNPQNNLKIIHIAGTNGKGTVAHMISNALQQAGCKVGLFTSPWVVDYTEQIQINATCIPKDTFAYYVNLLKDFDCTEFELLTAIMFKYFYDQNVDYAVVECGMGGLQDSTNVASNTLISVITSVSMDHIGFLGNTLTDIATQKAGIIKPNSDCVLYPNSACQSVFENTCKNIDTKLHIIEPQSSYQQNNLATAQVVIDLLNIKSTVSIPSLPARQQVISKNNKLITIDGAHNFDGALALKSNFPKGSVTAIVAMMADKDIDSYLSVISPLCSCVITTNIQNNKRAISSKDLAAVANLYNSNVIPTKNLNSALHQAFAQSDNILICGSFYLAREYFQQF